MCGTAAAALDEIGGIAVETVTEDAHTALRMQRRGWNTAYINIPQAAGLATESLSAHIGQRIRWARGMVQILRRENPLFGRGLSLAQRLCYFNATTHFLFAVPRLIFLTVPLTYLLLGMVNIYGYSLAVFAYALPHIVLSQLANARIQKGFRSSFWNEIYEAVLAPYILLPTLLALINPRLGRFNVTAKGGIVDRSYFDHRVALPLLVLLGLNVAGLIMAYQRFVGDPAHHDTVIMNAVWTGYNIVILLVAASVAREKRQRRADVRVDVRVPLTLVTRQGLAIPGVSAQLSRRGMTAYVEDHMTLRPDSTVRVVFDPLDPRGVCCEVTARVVSARRRALHLLFSRLDTAQETLPRQRNLFAAPGLGRLGCEHARLSTAKSLAYRLAVTAGHCRVVGGLLTPPRAPRRPDDRRRKGPETCGGGDCVRSPAEPLDAACRGERSRSIGATAAVVEPSMFHDAYALGDIAGQGQHDDALGAGASLNFFFGVPVTKIISQATLGLRYRRAPASSRRSPARAVPQRHDASASIRLVPGTDVQSEIPLHTDLLTTDNALSLRLDGRCRRVRPGTGAVGHGRPEEQSRLSAARSCRWPTTSRCSRSRFSIPRPSALGSCPSSSRMLRRPTR